MSTRDRYEIIGEGGNPDLQTEEDEYAQRINSFNSVGVDQPYTVERIEINQEHDNASSLQRQTKSKGFLSGKTPVFKARRKRKFNVFNTKGVISDKHVMGEFSVFVLFWSFLGLLRNQVPPDIYKWIALATSPLTISLITFLLAILVLWRMYQTWENSLSVEEKLEEKVPRAFNADDSISVPVEETTELLRGFSLTLADQRRNISRVASLLMFLLSYVITSQILESLN